MRRALTAIAALAALAVLAGCSAADDTDSSASPTTSTISGDAGVTVSDDTTAAPEITVPGGDPPTDLVSEVDPRRPQHVLLPLLRGTEEHIDLLRIDPGIGNALLGCLDRHGVGRHGRIGDVLLVDPQLLSDHPQRKAAGRGDLLGRHDGVGQIHAGGNDAHREVVVTVHVAAS